MKQDYKCRKRWLTAVLAVMLMLLMAPAAHAYEYVTLSGSTGYTSAYLNSTCSGRHVKIEGSATTLNIYEDVSIKEIFAPNTEVTIVLNNGARFVVTQDEGEITAVNAKSLIIRGNGYVTITGRNDAVGIHGGQLVVYNSTATFQGLARDAIVAKQGSTIAFGNSAVDIKAAKLAVASWEEDQRIASFTIDGDNSNTIVKGGINFVNTFRISGGYYNQNTNSGPSGYSNWHTSGIVASNVQLTGGKIYVNQGGHRFEYTEDFPGIISDYFSASNCTLEVNSAYTALYTRYDATFYNTNARLMSRQWNGIMSVLGEVSFTGDTWSSTVLAKGGVIGVYAPTVNIGGYKLVARGDISAGVYAHTINVSPSMEGCLYEAYGKTYPFIAQNMDGDASINLQRPTEIYGSVPGQEGVFPGEVLSGSGADGNNQFFGRSNGVAFSNYVKLQMPHIQNITGVNSPFLLMAGGHQNTKTVIPGDTMQVNLSPLLPYVYTPYGTLAKTVKIVRRNGAAGTSAVVAEEEVAGSVWSYTFTEQDVNCYVTAEVTVDGYLGELRSRQYYVHKLENWSYPIKPTLALSTGKIAVTNARTSQEYILLNETQYNQFVSSPDDKSWWQNSVSPTSNGTMTLAGGTQGAINYVVTRYKETATYWAGYRHEYNSILFDTSTLTAGLNVTLTPVGSNYVELEYLNGHETYTTKKNGVVKLTINPLPASATDFPGIRGQDFSISAYFDGTTTHDLCALYSNSSCTTPLNANTRYTTVYMKPLRSGCNQLALGVSLYADGDEDPLVPGKQIYLNVSEDDGSFLPYTLIVNNGEPLVNHSNDVEGIPFTVFPARATLSGDVTVTYYHVQGPFPTQAGQAKRRPTFTVDKEKRTINMIAPTEADMLVDHTYTFTVAHKVNGTTYGYGYMPVQVVEKPIYSLNIEPAEADVAPGGTLDLTITSNMEEAWRQYNTNGRTTVASSNEEVATVAYDNNKRTYVVTMTDNEDMMGESAVITLNVNGVEATCRVTVNGERYPLWIAGTQVNTNNATDVLGDGTVNYMGSSQGGTLTLSGSEINGSILSEIPALVVDVRASTVAVSSGSRFDGDNTYFTGDGLFQSAIGGSTTSAFIAKNLTVADSVIIRAWCNAPAFVANNLTVVGDSAEVQAYSYRKASMYVNESLIGTITMPEGAVLNPATGWVAVGPDDLNNYVTADFVCVKGLMEENVLRGDVNGDGVVSGADVTALYNVLLDGATVAGDADVNGDGVVSGADVTALYNLLLN